MFNIRDQARNVGYINKPDMKLPTLWKVFQRSSDGLEQRKKSDCGGYAQIKLEELFEKVGYE